MLFPGKWLRPYTTEGIWRQSADISLTFREGKKLHINQYIWYLAYLGYHKNSLWKQQHFCIYAEDYLYFYAYKVPVGHSQLIVRSAIMETNYGSYKEIEHPERWRSVTLGQPTSQQAEFVPDSEYLWVWLLSYWLSLPELLD